MQGTIEQEGKIAGGSGATSLGCCGVSQQLHLMGLQGDLAVGEIEDDVPHQPKTRLLIGSVGPTTPTVMTLGLGRAPVC